MVGPGVGRVKRGAVAGGDGWYDGPMNRQDIIARLRENEAALRARRVTHAALLAHARGGWMGRRAIPTS